MHGDGGCNRGRSALAWHHSSNEPSELSQWLCGHDDSIINIILVIIIIIIIISGCTARLCVCVVEESEQSCCKSFVRCSGHKFIDERRCSSLADVWTNWSRCATRGNFSRPRSNSCSPSAFRICTATYWLVLPLNSSLFLSPFLTAIFQVDLG